MISHNIAEVACALNCFIVLLVILFARLNIFIEL